MTCTNARFRRISVRFSPHPETQRVRLGYDRVRLLLGHYGNGLRLHQLRRSTAIHLGKAGHSANVIMANTGHKNLRSLQHYVKPGLTAVHQATETLFSPRRAPRKRVADRRIAPGRSYPSTGHSAGRHRLVSARHACLQLTAYSDAQEPILPITPIGSPQEIGRAFYARGQTYDSE